MKRSRWLIPVLVMSLSLGMQTAALGSAPHRGGVSIGGSARVANPDTTSAPCIGAGPVAAGCQSTDPQVTFHMVSVGDTTSCTFSTAVDWGDKTAVTSQSYPGGTDGTDLVLFSHVYTKPGTYTISGTSTATGNCYGNPFTVQFTLLSSTKLITSPVGGSIIPLTDRTLVQSPPTDSKSVPGPYGLKVAGKMPCACSMKVNGKSAEVSGGNWHIVLTEMKTGPLTITAVAGDGKREQIEVTLIDLRVVKPVDEATVPVTAAPAMPDLDATLEVAGYPGGVPQTASFKWTLEVYNRWATRQAERKTVNGKVQTVQVTVWHEGPTKVATGSTVGTAAVWHPGYEDVTLGGWGRLVITAALAGVPGEVTSSPRWFNMPGTNPARPALNAFIADNAGGDAGTITQLVCHESGYRQFAKKSPAAYKETKLPSNLADPAAMRPVFGPPAGVGIMQLDPATYPAQQWDWKLNVLGGIQTFGQKRTYAAAYPAQVQKALNTARQSFLVNVNKERAAHKPKLALLTLADIPQAEVPAYTAAQLTQDTIRGYNGYAGKPAKPGGKKPIVHQFTFDAGYVITKGLIVELAGSHTWKPTAAAKFFTNPGYVESVQKCV